MNTSIRKLAEEATNYCCSHYSDIGTKSTAWLWEDKFAEYIVEYCAKIIDTAVEHRVPASTYSTLLRQLKSN